MSKQNHCYPPMIKNLQSSDTQAVLKVTQIMKSHAFRKNDPCELIKLGAVDIMLNIVSTSDLCSSESRSERHVVYTNILSIIADWCVDYKQAQLCVLEQHRLANIIEILDKDCHHSLKERAARVIANLTCDKSSHVLSVLSKTGVLPIVIKLIDKETIDNDKGAASSRLHLYCKLVRQLCRLDSQLDVVIDQNCIQILAKLLKSEDDSLISRILRILCDFISRRCSVAFATQITKAGVVKKLVGWCQADDKDRHNNSLTLVLNLTAQVDSRVAIGNEGGIQALMDLLGDDKCDFRWDKILNGLCFLCSEAVNRVRLRDCGFLEQAVVFMEHDKYNIMHPRLISSLTYFLRDEPSVDKLCSVKFVTVMLMHLRKSCDPVLGKVIFEPLEPSQPLLDLFTINAALIKNKNQSSKRRRSDEFTKICDASDLKLNPNKLTKAVDDKSPNKSRSKHDVESFEIFNGTQKSYSNDANAGFGMIDNSEDTRSDFFDHYSTVGSYLSSSQSLMSDSLDTRSGDAERNIFRASSPTYIAQVKKNQDVDDDDGDETASHSSKYGPLTYTSYKSPDSKRSLPTFHHSPCRTYGPVASPMSFSGTSSPISFTSDSVYEYSSEEEYDGEGTVTFPRAIKVTDATKAVLKYVNLCQNKDRDGSLLGDFVNSKEVSSNEKDCQYDEFYNNIKSARTDEKIAQNENEIYNKLELHKKGICESQTDQNLGKAHSDLAKNDINESNMAEKCNGKESTSKIDEKRANNIVSILAAISYNKNNICLVTHDSIVSIVDYLCNSKPFNMKLLRVLDNLLKDKLLFEKFIDIDAPRLISSQMLKFRYTKRRKTFLKDMLSITSHFPPSSPTQVATIDTSLTSYSDWYTETLIDKNTQIAGAQLLESISCICDDWYGIGTIERLLCISDPVSKLRISVSLLYACSCTESIKKLLIHTDLFYGMLSMLVTNENTTHAIVGGLHFLFKSLLMMKKAPQRQWPDLLNYPRVTNDNIFEVLSNKTSCVYSAIDHDITIIHDDQHLKGHRSTLAETSVVFDAMLMGNFKESREDHVRINPLTGSNAEAFIFLLHHIHGCGLSCDVISSVMLSSESNAKSLMKTCLGIQQLADYYEIGNISEYISQIIEDQRTLSTIADVYEFAVNQMNEELQVDSLQFLLTCSGDNGERLKILLGLIEKHGRSVIHTIYNNLLELVN